MSTRKMPKRVISVMAPFENVSAKLALVREKAGINNGGIKYFGVRRQSRLTVNGTVLENKFYLRKYGRKNEPSTKELDIREAFTGASKWSALATHDLSAMTHNQQVYYACKEDRTLKCGNVRWNGEEFAGFCTKFAFDVLYWQKGTLPENHQLPDPE